MGAPSLPGREQYPDGTAFCANGCGLVATHERLITVAVESPLAAQMGEADGMVETVLQVCAACFYDDTSNGDLDGLDVVER